MIRGLKVWAGLLVLPIVSLSAQTNDVARTSIGIDLVLGKSRGKRY